MFGCCCFTCLANVGHGDCDHVGGEYDEGDGYEIVSMVMVIVVVQHGDGECGGGDGSECGGLSW